MIAPTGSVVLYFDAAMTDSHNGRAAIVVGQNEDAGYVNVAVFPDSATDVRDHRLMPIIGRIRVRVVSELPENWRSSGPYVMRCSEVRDTVDAIYPEIPVSKNGEPVPGEFEDYEIKVDQEASFAEAVAPTMEPTMEKVAQMDDKIVETIRVAAINQLVAFPAWNREIVEKFQGDGFSIVFERSSLKITNKHKIQIASIRFYEQEERRGYELATQRGKQLRTHLRMQRDATQVLSMVIVLSRIMEAAKDAETSLSASRRIKAAILAQHPKE